ncbi:MAG: flagellar type III secretion system pore protein FliP [Clostridia bacterium]|nr:flagellar type III secretion system pore protein FliP [Clostridia bacterium]MDD4145536.1 flagellar type III secretion system pore protein FliP [Clostridia bacterium]MDD4664988.1 flagellar type III secretion system pore protein FliP [Clostridia bacterium]
MNRFFKRKIILVVLLSLVVLLFSPVDVAAAPIPLPKIGVEIGSADTPQDVALSLQILALLTILTLAPAILILMTSFTRIIVVFSFLRNALATQQMPPNQVLIGLALFLTFFIMTPVWSEINQNALQPYLHEEITQETAYHNAVTPLRTFMLKQTREKDLALFINMSSAPKPDNPDDIPTYVVIPAFTISELKTAFQIGFIIYIPFIIIDMVVASTLMSMGMMMLPPMMISLPFKLLLFILVDGWNLVVQSLLLGFR